MVLFADFDLCLNNESIVIVLQAVFEGTLEIDKDCQLNENKIVFFFFK